MNRAKVQHEINIDLIGNQKAIAKTIESIASVTELIIEKIK